MIKENEAARLAELSAISVIAFIDACMAENDLAVFGELKALLAQKPASEVNNICIAFTLGRIAFLRYYQALQQEYGQKEGKR